MQILPAQRGPLGSILLALGGRYASFVAMGALPRRGARSASRPAGALAQGIRAPAQLRQVLYRPKPFVLSAGRR
jgi:hypothetical protein